MIDTARVQSVMRRTLAEAGAVEVYASCTHPVLSGPAMDNIQNQPLRSWWCWIRFIYRKID